MNIKIEIRPVTLSPSSDYFTYREREATLSHTKLYIQVTLHYILHIKMYVYRLSSLAKSRSLFWSHDSAHICMKQRVRTGHPLPWGFPNTNVDTQEAEQHMHLEMLSWYGTDHIYVIRLDDSAGNARIPIEEIKQKYRHTESWVTEVVCSYHSEFHSCSFLVFHVPSLGLYDVCWFPVSFNTLCRVCSSFYFWDVDQYLHWSWSSFNWKRKK